MKYRGDTSCYLVGGKAEISRKVPYDIDRDRTFNVFSQPSKALCEQKETVPF